MVTTIAPNIGSPDLWPASRRILSRLTTVTQLLGWNANRPSRPADALLIMRRLAGDLVGFARTLEGLTPTVPASPSTISVNLLELRDNPAKTVLSSIAGLLQKPWEEWHPEQQVRLGDQVLNACERAVELLRVRSIVSDDARKATKKGAAILVVVICCAVLASGWRAYTSFSSPRYYAQRMEDLATIRAALDGYRTAHGAYPISSADGERWNGIGWEGFRENWIPGLVPELVQTLPRDPRMAENPFEQYIYRSNGKDYKLLVLVPDDCTYVVQKHPDMDDPVRNYHKFGAGSKPVRECRAYGFWSAGAVLW